MKKKFEISKWLKLNFTVKNKNDKIFKVKQCVIINFELMLEDKPVSMDKLALPSSNSP